MSDEVEETRKMVEKLDKRDKVLAQLRQAHKETNDKVTVKELALEKTEEDKKKAEKKAEKLEKKMMVGSWRAARLATDGVGSLGAQTLNLGQQALLDYLIEAFPKTVGKHQVLIKGLPPVMALLWYFVEIITLKGAGSVPKHMRLTAANILSNLNFVHMAQAFRRDQGQKQSEQARLGQSVEELTAAQEQLGQDLEKAKRMLKDKGIDFESSDNG